MAHKVVKEITQAVHGEGDRVMFSPGQQFDEEVELPEGTPYRLAVAVVPAPLPAASAARKPKDAAG